MTISFDSFFLAFVDLSLFDVIKRVFLRKKFDFFLLKGFYRNNNKKAFSENLTFQHVMSYLRFKMKKKKLYLSVKKKKKKKK